MSTTIRIGRWTAELYQRAIYLQQRPKPNCPECGGVGAVEVGGGYVLDHTWEPDSAPCPCWDPYRAKRIPLWRRAKIVEPF
ncbi:hypothetical protein GCM10010331_49810 [Streptomyces xanthochromogenes]|uniref:hypothetical protein n=1 Tax=Streptomyces xanthochromogenes TaxID=67384 RepID=UPI001671DA12|nr:hypothetical protein [Streptomyces xanthochromogenes]GHB55970.1 hypothetical protein GCM10010331_49810 [Streptomyces xanthochromogenes]